MNRSNITVPGPLVVASAPAIGMCRIGILISSFILNFTVLSVYILRPKMRTPFAVYIISLLISNILDLLLYFPFMIANNIGTDTNHFVFGETGCSVFGYGVSISRAFCLCSHALITLNRIWAMTFPISYKNLHGYRFAVMLCSGVFIAIHALMIQGLVLSERSRPRPVEKWGCWYQVRTGSVANSIGFHLFYTAPVLIVATYPYLFFKYLQTKKRIMAQDGHHGLHDKTVNKTFGIVSMLSLCTIICWVPEDVVTVLMNNTGSRAIIRSYPIVSLISSFQVLLDPLFLLISSKELRYGLMSIVCRRRFMADRAVSVKMMTSARSNTKPVRPTSSTKF
ncbi:rhodopsin-like [Paramacrobiotus metropolitanus]|uniref:rhodopsin-like n=1 Tax=Paramacrobiotus metropolitanus TaxID=2943436 RepID=UPI0024459CD4|nr:rhodopsin-like [Paramacrobiotus metropolitanus]